MWWGLSTLWTWLAALWRTPRSFMIAGLDNAGKTTLTRRMVDGTLTSPPPTQRASTVDAAVDGVPCRVIDLGGHEEARAAWADYYAALDAIIYVVDLSDAARLPEAFAALSGVLAAVPDAPLLVLLNKVDVAGAGIGEQRRLEMGRALEQAAGARPYNVVVCALTGQTGWPAGLSWLAGVVH